MRTQTRYYPIQKNYAEQHHLIGDLANKAMEQIDNSFQQMKEMRKNVTYDQYLKEVGQNINRINQECDGFERRIIGYKLESMANEHIHQEILKKDWDNLFNYTDFVQKENGVLSLLKKWKLRITKEMQLKLKDNLKVKHQQRYSL